MGELIRQNNTSRKTFTPTQQSPSWMLLHARRVQAITIQLYYTDAKVIVEGAWKWGGIPCTFTFTHVYKTTQLAMEYAYRQEYAHVTPVVQDMKRITQDDAQAKH